jgi:hypothetical protein
MHILTHDHTAAVNSSSSSSSSSSTEVAGQSTHSSSDVTASSAQSVATALDTVDILLIDVERPTGPTTSSQVWGTSYNLLYQVHGFVGLIREAYCQMAGRSWAGLGGQTGLLDLLAGFLSSQLQFEVTMTMMLFVWFASMLVSVWQGVVANRAVASPERKATLYCD